MDSELEIIERARLAFDEYDDLRERLMVAESRIKGLCREYGIAMRVWGWTPIMLRKAVEARLGRRCA